MNTRHYLVVIAFTLITPHLHGAVGASQNSEQTNLEAEQKVISTDRYWATINRNTARYPIIAKQSNINGCATVEYTLTPSNQITNINVVSASNNYFAQAARSAIDRWDLSTVEGQLDDADVVIQTRFEFCNEDSAPNCGTQPVSESFCKGDDVIAVVSNYRPINASSDISIDRARNKLREMEQN